MKPRVLVLSGCGINCERETAYTFSLPAVGGEAVCVHLNDLTAQPDQLDGFHVMVIPGGFAFGDDIAAGIVPGHPAALPAGAALEQVFGRW